MLHVIGDTFVDVFCATSELPKWGKDVVLEQGLSLKAGGSAANTASHLGSLAAGYFREEQQYQNKVVFHTMLGKDEFGAMMAKHLENAKVRLVDCNTLDVPISTGVCVVVSGREDRAFMTSYGAMAHMEVAHLKLENFVNCKHLHIGGYFSLPKLQPGIADFIKQLRQLNPEMTVSLDTNYDGSERWGQDQDHLSKLLEQVDIFLPNESEARGIAGHSEIGELDQVAHILALKLRQNGTVVITCGKDGVIGKSVQHNEPWKLPSDFLESIVDTTGCGDAFNAGFLFDYVFLEKTPMEAAKNGIKAGTFASQHPGACEVLLNLEALST